MNGMGGISLRDVSERELRLCALIRPQNRTSNSIYSYPNVTLVVTFSYLLLS